MARRRAAGAALAAAAALLLGGCWDRRELEDMAFVLALGVDAVAPGEGAAPTGEPGARAAAAPMEVTLMIAVPNAMDGEEGGGGGGGGGKKVLTTHVRALSLTDAIQLANTFINREVSLKHVKTLVVSEEMARLGVLPRLADSLARQPALRRSLAVLISRGRAGDFLARARPELERDPGRYLELLPLAERWTGFSPRGTRLHQLLTQEDTPGGAPLLGLVATRPDKGREREEEGEEKGGGGGKPHEEAAPTAGAAPVRPGGGEVAGRLSPLAVPRRGGPNVDLVGAAVIRDGRMVGELTGEAVRVAQMLRGEFQSALITLPDPEAPGHQVTLRLKAGRAPRVRAFWAPDGRVQIDAHVFLEGELYGVDSRLDYTEPARRARLEAATARHLADLAEELVRVSQRQWQADIFGFGYQAAALFPTYGDWVAYDWNRRWPEATVYPRFTVVLRRFGTLLGPPLRRDR